MQKWLAIYFIGSLLLLAGCQSDISVYQAQRDLKSLIQTSTPIFNHNNVALLHCSNGADQQKIREAINQTKQAVDPWFDDQAQSYTSRLLIFTPDEPLGKQLIKEMRSGNGIAGSTEARTHTILVAGYPANKDFWITLRHELVHDAMLRHYQSVDQLPPFWFTEGLATVFEVPTNADGKPSINQSRLHRLKSQYQHGPLNVMPLITRIADERSSSKDYAIAWGLTYYLLQEQPVALQQYLTDYQQQPHSTSMAHQAAFEKYFAQSKSIGILLDKLKFWATQHTLNGLSFDTP